MWVQIYLLLHVTKVVHHVLTCKMGIITVALICYHHIVVLSCNLGSSLFQRALEGRKTSVLYSTVSLVAVSSDQFSHSVVSDSLRPHEPQHARPPCPSPTPTVYPNPCSLSRWCHPTISSAVVPFSSCPQSFPASGSFPMSQLFASGGQSVGVSASASVLARNTQGWSLERTGWISFQSKGLSRVFSNTTVQKHQFFGAQPSL